MDFRFLHAADIHLDSPLRGLAAYEGAPVEQFRNATRQALRNLVDHAIEQAVAFVVIAGDLYDGDWPDFSTGLFLVKELERLNQARIRVAVLFGNHDAANRITRSLPWPGNARVFSHQKPETIRFDDLGVALHGQSFSRMDVTDNLASSYPPPLAGQINIGVLHTALAGNTRHTTYAPCSLDQLRNHGYDYWALGHVHGYEILSREPWVVFPGNLQGRHIRETGAKGCVSVSVRDGVIVSVDPVVLDVVRWVVADVDATECGDLAAVSARAAGAIRTALTDQAGNRPAAVRVSIHGHTPAHAELVATSAAFEAGLQAMMLGFGECWLEQVKLRTAPEKISGGTGTAEAEGLLAGLLADADSNPELKASLHLALKPLLDKLPAGLGADAASGETEDAPLLAALRAGDTAALVQAVLPDLQAARPVN